MSPHIETDAMLDYLNGAMAGDRRADLEDHLAACPECRAEMAKWRQLSGRVAGYLSPERASEAAWPSAAVSVADILSRGRREVTRDRRRGAFGRRLTIRLGAAALVTLLLASPFFSPYSARALAKVPGVGALFSTVAIEKGLAVAYQAGLVDELDRSVTAQGLTFSVVGAYADSTQTAVICVLKGDRGLMDKLWDELGQAGRLDLTLSDSLGHVYRSASWSAEYDAEAGEQRILWQTSPLPFYVGHLKARLTIGGGSVSGDWEVSFPIQRISEEMTTEVPIDRSFTAADGTPIHLDKLVFSPSRTVLHYHFERPVEEEPKVETPEWTLLADGEPLARLGGGGGGGGPAGGTFTFTGTAAFMPTKAREITIRFNGFSGGYQLGWKLPLQAGAKATWEGFTFEISRAAVEDGKTVVEGVIKGGSMKFDGVLVTADGREIMGSVQSFVPDAEGKGGTYTLAFGEPVDLAGTTLWIERGHGTKPDSWSTTVTIDR